MHWGALTELAGVGVAINFGFGIVQSFRELLRQILTKEVNTVAARISSQQLDGAKIPIPKRHRRHARKLHMSFLKNSERAQNVFAVLVLGVAAFLVAFMMYVPMHAEEECLHPRRWVCIVAGLTVGPLSIWALTLVLYYAFVSSSLHGIVKKVEGAIEALTEDKLLTEKDIEPTDPDPDDGNKKG